MESVCKLNKWMKSKFFVQLFNFPTWVSIDSHLILIFFPLLVRAQCNISEFFCIITTSLSIQSSEQIRSTLTAGKKGTNRGKDEWGWSLAGEMADRNSVKIRQNKFMSEKNIMPITYYKHSFFFKTFFWVLSYSWIRKDFFWAMFSI